MIAAQLAEIVGDRNLLTGDAISADYAHDVGMFMSRRHEVCDSDFAAVRFVCGLKHQRLRKIAARCFCTSAGREQPASVVFGSEQGGEAGAGIKSRPAKPV